MTAQSHPLPLLLAAASLFLASAVRWHAAPSEQAPPVAAEAVQMIAMGRESAAATTLWMQTVDRYASGQATPEQIAAHVRAIGALDPTWTEPWFFGALMLPDSATDIRNELIDEAAELHPEVPWFAWRAGMRRLGTDRDVALDWLRKAATAPGADPAYAALLAALQDAP